MFRSERMSHTSILFLKSDTESALQVLDSHGTFHLQLKEVESRGSDYADKIYELLNNARDMANKASTLIGTIPIPIEPVKAPVDAADWPSFISKVEAQLSSVGEKVNALDSSVQEEDRIKQILEIWGKVVSSAGKVDLSLINAFKRFKIKILYNDAVPETRLDGRLPDSSVAVTVSDTPSIVIVAFLPADEDKVSRAAEELGYKTIEQYKGMPSNLSDLPAYLQDLKGQLEALTKKNDESRKALAEEWPWLSYINATLTDAYSVLSIKEKATVEGRWVLLEGYVPTKLEPKLSSELFTILNGRVIMFAYEEHSSDKVPTTYSYPKYFKWFESITNLYGWPSYKEINPTPLLAFTFPIFFGLMFGDIGQGIIFAVLGFFIYKYTKSYRKVGLLFAVCGVFGAVIGGVAYGDTFGKSLAEFTGGLITYSGYFSINGGTTIGNLFRLSIYIGVAQMLVGMIFGMVDGIWQKKKAEILLVRVPKLLIYIDLVYMAIVIMLTKTINFGALTTPILLLLPPIFALLLADPLYLMYEKGRKAGMSHLGESGIDVFETLLMYVSNTVSYLRIFALLAAHVELMAAFYLLGSIIAGPNPTLVGSVAVWALAIAGNILVILLEGLIVFAQSLRLHFYEWFSKFYSGSGVRFSPFKLSLGVPIVRSKKNE